MLHHDVYYFFADYIWMLMWIPLTFTYYLIYEAGRNVSTMNLIVRTLFAIALLYISLNFVLHFSHVVEWWGYNIYLEKHPDCEFKLCDGEHKIRESGANFAFAYLFGWLPALLFVGLLEFGLRYRKYRTGQPYQKGSGSYYFSCLVIFLSGFIIVLIFSYILFAEIQRIEVFSLSVVSKTIFQFIYVLVMLIVGMVGALFPVLVWKTIRRIYGSFNKKNDELNF